MMLPQNLTEQVFAERIAALGGVIHREVEAVAVVTGH